MKPEIKLVLGILGVLLVGVVFIAYFIFVSGPSFEQEEIASFEECLERGYEVMESYPRRCRTPQGDIFVELVEGDILEIENAKQMIPNIQRETGGAYLIQDNEDYVSLFAEDSEIDFDKYSLLVVFAGERMSGGYSIEVSNVVEKPDSLEVYITEKSPGEGCFVTMALTYPYDAVIFEKTSQSLVEFSYDYEVIDC